MAPRHEAEKREGGSLPDVSRDGREAGEASPEQEIGTAGGGGRPPRGPTQSEMLIGYAGQAELFHAPDGECYATVEVEDHRENWPLKGVRFGQWLLKRFYGETGKAPGAQALTDARSTIAARAMFEGPERPVSVRVAKHEETVYLDLCNEGWEAVEITASGWRLVSGQALPVRFVRKGNAAPLPRPEGGGTVETLRPLLNVRSEDDFRLVVAWLIGALNPDGPYPVLVLQGEQGSAKSTTVRVLRSLVDPALEALRSPPRDERDLAIAASGNWTPALDNLSGVRPWLSDALCRLATGGGFATRELYSDDREVIFSQKRPVILNGIDALASAGDLRDRGLIVELPPIPPENKRTERDFYRELDGARPRVLGALLDAVSAALRNLDRVQLKELPRMADFAVWVAAAEQALPWEPGAFMDAYTGNRSEANELALDDEPVAVAIRRLLATREEWSGTSTELLAKLGELTDEAVRRSKAWPGAPNVLSNRLKRISPSLRDAGIEYEENTEGHSRRKTKTLRKVAGSTDRTDREAGTRAGSEGRLAAGANSGADDAVGGSRALSGGDGRVRFTL